VLDRISRQVDEYRQVKRNNATDGALLVLLCVRSGSETIEALSSLSLYMLLSLCFRQVQVQVDGGRSVCAEQAQVDSPSHTAVAEFGARSKVLFGAFPSTHRPARSFGLDPEDKVGSCRVTRFWTEQFC
jgi:hypothetical protein